MVVTSEALATKLVYLKENHYMPNIENETPDVQRSIRSYYYGESISDRTGIIIKNNPFWFTLAFCEYQVTDEFVHEINREFKRFKLLNIGKDEY